MRYVYYTLISMVMLWSNALADNGLIHSKSAHTVQVTADRLETLLRNKGMTVFSRIDHAQGANTIGSTLRPTQLIIFGNPKVGTALMQCQQSVGIDLPMKALIWQDNKNQVWFSYHSSTYLAKKHQITGCDTVLKKVDKALSNFALAATQP